MSDGWVKTNLGEVGRFVNGYPFKPGDLSGSALPVIRIKQLLDPNAEVDFTDVVVPEKNRIDDGDLIFSWSGSLASRIWDRGPAALNQHLFRVEARQGVDLEFLHLLLDHAVEDLLTKTHGTTMKHVTKKVLESHSVELPPLVLQRRIVDLMAHLDTHITNLRAEREAVATLLEACLDAAWKSLATAPNVSLESVAECSWGNTSLTKSAYTLDGDIAFSASGPDGFVARGEMEGPAVVLSAIGARCGGTWQATGRWTAIKNTIWFRSSSEDFLTEFLYWVTSDPSTFPKRGQAQPFISLGDVRAHEIPAVTLNEQEVFVNHFNAVMEAGEALDREIHELVRSRSALLAKLLNRGIQIANHYDALLAEVA